MDLKFRIKPTRRNLTATAAVVLAAGLGAFVLLDLLFANQLTPSRAVALLEKTSPRLVSVLRANFSADFATIVKTTVESESELTSASAGANAVARFLGHQAQPITERYDETARQAPPQLVADWMGKLADAMAGVQKVAGAELCSQFVKEGQSVLTDPAMLADLAPAFDARDAALFVALAGARDTPVAEPVGEATDEDWQVVQAAMNGLEVPAGYAQIVANDDTGSNDYCSALAYYFRTVRDLPGESGQRIRAEYFIGSFS
jgi:hypothetical protein